MQKALILLLVFNTSIQAASFSQKKIKLVRNSISMSDIFKHIQKETDFGILYKLEDVKEYDKLNVNYLEVDADFIIRDVLKGTDLKIKKLKDVIIVYKNANKVSVESKQEKKKTIEGKITDTKNVPLPGVSIVIKGTTFGAATDIDGKFKIDASKYANKKIILVASFIGMKTKEVEYKNQANLVIKLEDDSETINEVVVTGYQKVDRKLFTGSATKVKAEDAKVSGIVDIGSMLEGKAAGVAVQTVSGSFGASPKIRVRGASSIYGDQKPLWVVDGVVLEDVVDVSADQLSSGDVSTLISSAVAGLNAEDIADFQILKDVSATALYGARAMNGVIVITTKKGHVGKPRLTYSGEFTMRLKPSYDDYNIMNSRDQLSIYREMERKGWLNHADISRASSGGVYNRMYNLINTYDPSTGKFLLENTVEARTNFLKDYEMVNTDWFDELFKNSIIQNHSLSVSSGSENSSYYFSTSFYNDEGFSIADNVKRYTANMSAKYNLTDKLTFGFNTVGSIREQRAPGTLNRSEDVVNGSYSRDFDINPFSYALNTSRVLRAYDENGNYEFYRRNYAPFNILNETKNNYIDLDVLDLKLQADLSYKIMKGLDLSVVGSMRYVKSSQKHIVKSKSNMAEAYRAANSSHELDNNPFLYRDVDNPDALAQVVLPKGGFYKKTENKLVNYYLRSMVNWNKTFNETHIVNILAGQEVRSADRETDSFDGIGMQYDKGYVPFVDYKYIQQSLQNGVDYYSASRTYDRFVAFFSDMKYSYLGKYIIGGTVRYDGSNKLGKSKSSRWLPTWNVTGSWNISEEEFMKSNPTISYLKLNASYGLTASMGAATNSQIILRNQVTDRPYTGEKESQIYISALENSELTWEKQYETNIGFEIGLLDNRISIQSDIYKRDGFDLIGVVSTSGIGGESLKYANYADMESKGIEFSLNTKNIVNKDFKWTTNLTFAYNENEITNLATDPQIYSLVRSTGGAKQGSPVRGLYSYRFKGLDKDGIPTLINNAGEVANESFYFQSKNTEHLKYEGPIDPKVTSGLTNTFEYKNWRLNVFVSSQFGNYIRLNPVFQARYSDLSSMPKEFYDRYGQLGDEKITNIPTILSKRQHDSKYTSTYNAYNLSDARVAKGDFVKVKEISLAYKLSKSVTEKLGIGSLSAKIQATNLFLLYADSKLNGQDPEFYGNGGVALPVPKQFTLSVKVGF